MAEPLDRDVIIDSDEWTAILGQIKIKDNSVKTKLSAFISALDVLATDAFESGTRSENIAQFKKEVEKLQTQLNDIYTSIETAITDLYTEADDKDKFSWFSTLY